MSESRAPRTVAITGAASGIGAAVARVFAGEGDRLLLLDRRPLPETLSAELAELAGLERRWVAEVDVASTSGVDQALTAGQAALGAVDVLVNNAGISVHRRFVDITEEQWDEMIEVNLKSVYNTCRAVVPVMQDLGRGKIINVASELGLVGAASMVHYSASKGGVIAFTKALAHELAPGGSTSTPSRQVRSRPPCSPRVRTSTTTRRCPACLSGGGASPRTSPPPSDSWPPRRPPSTPDGCSVPTAVW